MAVIGAVDLEEMHLISKLSLEFVDNLVPLRHELDAPATGWHEEVYDYEFVGTVEFFDFGIKVFVAIRHLTLCLFPPVEIHRVFFAC